MAERGHRRSAFQFRTLAGATTALSFLAMLASGAVMFVAPSGRIARQTDWSALGLDRFGWDRVHVSFAALFVLAGIAHLASNWHPFRRYFQERATHRATLSREVATALALAIALAALAAGDLPPASWLMDLHRGFRHAG